MSQFFVNVSDGNLPPDVPTTFTEDLGTATPAANNLNIIGGTGIVTSGFGSTITINVVQGGFTWIETAISLGISAQVGVFCTAALTVTLPPTGILIGSTVYIYADTAEQVVIQANTGQFIEIGNSTSSEGGTATSNKAGNLVWLVFRPNDLTWHSFSSIGSWITA